MVRGIEKFKDAFAEFADNYVIIGGTACEHHEERDGQNPRATRDIDMILVVEALTHDFVRRFWDFIKEAGYTEKQVGEKGKDTKHQYYRFQKPSNSAYPSQIELFSRSLGIFDLPADMHITPIPTDADLSSLSAILMDDDYYYYTLDHSVLAEGVHMADVDSLIALKCKAYLEMISAKLNGREVDSKHIKKHRNDVFRLVATVKPELKYGVPSSLLDDINAFCESVKDNLPDANLTKDMGLPRVTPKQLFERLECLFVAQ